MKVLVTGTTGYVGGRLVPALLAARHEVRCVARTPAKLDAAPWRGDVSVVEASIASLTVDDLVGVDVAVYLVHSIGAGPTWITDEQRDATHFGELCAGAGVGRIVYLGGLGDERSSLSPHLASRQAVGRFLGAGGVPVTELRAGVVIGSGSASFEMLRYLVEVLPVMVTPRWVETAAQPIAVSDVIATLCGAVEEGTRGIFEIGGADVVSYSTLMEHYADVAGLPRRRLVKVPLLTPGLSSHWVGLVTPVPVPLARELVESLVNEVVADPTRRPPFGPTAPLGVREAITRALAATEGGRIPTRFDDADLVAFRPSPTDPAWSGGTVRRDVQVATTNASPAAVFASITSIGGERGWYGGEWLWRIRGLIDQLVGGPGLRRGRPPVVGIGDPLDFWRVDEYVPDTTLGLFAEMRLPGTARLVWTITPGATTTVTQTALFRPRGLWGRLYWWSVAPFHRFVFPGMLRGIVDDASRSAR